MKTLITNLALIILINVNAYSQWAQTPSFPVGGGVTEIVIAPDGSIIVSCGSFNYPSGPMGGIRRSTNNGTSWQSAFDYYTSRTVVLGQNNFVFSSAWNYPSVTEGLYASSNNGANWTLRFTIGTNNNIFSILPINNNQTIFIGTRNGVMKSTNGGFNFTASSTGMSANSWVYDLAVDDTNNIFAAATSNGLFISTNSGTQWQKTTGISNTDTMGCVFFTRTGTPNVRELFAGTTNGKLIKAPSSNLYSSASSITTIDSNLRVEDLDTMFWNTSLQKILAAGTPRNPSQSGSGVYKSSNAGLNWIAINDGFPSNPVVSSITQSDIGVYAGTYKNTSLGAEIFFRPRNTIGIQQISSEVPSGFSLSQNYPNPFNPETRIKFEIPASLRNERVKLSVYNTIGQQIALLVNEALDAGVYEYKFDASNLSNGIYFYSLSAGNYKETKKMMLIK